MERRSSTSLGGETLKTQQVNVQLRITSRSRYQLLCAARHKACGNPGRWMGGPDSSGCGNVRGATAAQLSMPGQLPWLLAGPYPSAPAACPHAWTSLSQDSREFQLARSWSTITLSSNLYRSITPPRCPCCCRGTMREGLPGVPGAATHGIRSRRALSTAARFLHRCSCSGHGLAARDSR